MSRSTIRITVPRLVGNCCGLPSEYLLEMVFTSKWGPEWSPNGSQMAPQRPLGASWPAEGLLERSWRALGAILGGLGAQKSNWNQLLDGPRPPRRLVSALPGGQIPSQREPRRVPNRGPKTIRAENSKTLIFNDSCEDFNDF